MNTKDYLEQILVLQRLVYCLDRRIEYRKDKLYQIGSPSFEPSNNTSRSTESRHAMKLMEIDELEDDRKKLMEMLCSLRREMQQLFDTLDGEESCLMAYRYLDQRSIREIGQKTLISKSSVDRRIKGIVEALKLPEGAYDVEKELIQAGLERYLSWL